MIVGNCHPTVTGLSIEATDKMIFSNLASKVATVKEWCRECPISRECAVQGFWTNEDGKRQALPGIFGGLTEAERKDFA